jgi:two-component system response regulator YesN
MYKVLLVDDEIWVLKGIRNIFEWNKFGFEILGMVTDPEEAYSFICKDLPDVVFTDIRMPEISGINLMKMSRDMGLKTEFIIISGFADFTYAQSAIKLGAFDYLLKPVKREDAISLLYRLKQYLDGKKVTQYHEEVFSSVIDTEQDHVSIDEPSKRIINYINTHFTNDISLGDVARELHLDYTYCSKLLKKVSGKTFPAYITELRMNLADKLIKDNELKIIDICRRTGYNDYFYFNKVFKKHFGVTPLQYRKSIFI